MSIERFDFFYDSDLSDGLSAYRKQRPDGDYVEYEAHVAEIAAKDAELWRTLHTLEALVAAGFVTQEKVDEARALMANLQPLAPVHPDTARLDKLPQCFHMLRYRNGLWHLTYETGKQYTNIREAIDAHHIWDAGPFGAECAAANQVFGPGGTFGGSTDGGAP